MTTPSTFGATLTPDKPLQQNARSSFGAPDWQRLDSQVLACQQFLSDLLLNGVVATYCDLDTGSAAAAVGDVVCAAGSTLSTVTLATSGALTAAGAPLGVVLVAASPGSKVLVALAGRVKPSVTGLAAASGYARVTSNRVAMVAVPSAGDYPLGAVDAAGVLTMHPSAAVQAILVGLTQIKGVDGSGAADGGLLQVKGGNPGDSSHHAGGVALQLGAPSASDGLTGEVALVSGSPGTGATPTNRVLEFHYDSGAVSLLPSALYMGGGDSAAPLVSTISIRARTAQIGSETHSNGVTVTGPVTLDFGKGNKQSLTAVGNVTITLVGGVDGPDYQVLFRQDGTGSRTITWGGGINFAADSVGGVNTTISSTPETTAGKYTAWVFEVISGTYVATRRWTY